MDLICGRGSDTRTEAASNTTNDEPHPRSYSATSPFPAPLWVRSACHVHFLNATIALTATYITVLLLICLRCKPGAVTRKPRWVRGPLSLLLLLSLSGELAEGLLVLLAGRAQSELEVKAGSGSQSQPLVPLPTLLLSVGAAAASLAAWLPGEFLDAYLRNHHHSVLHVVPSVTGASLAAARLVSSFQMFWWGSAQLDHIRPILGLITAVLYVLIAADDYLAYRTSVSDLIYINSPFTEEWSPYISSSKENVFRYSSYQYGSASFYSKATFYWLMPLLRLGSISPLEVEDLGEIPETETTKYHFGKFQDIYNRLKDGSGTHVSLWRCYVLHSWKMFTLGGVFKFFGDMVGFVGPLGISVIVHYVQENCQHENILKLPQQKDQTYVTTADFFSNGYIMGVLVFLAAILQGSLSQSSTHLVNVEGIHIKSALQAMIYDKSLRLPVWSILQEDVEDSTLPDKDLQTDTKRGRVSVSHGSDISTHARSRPLITSNSRSSCTSPIDAGSISNLISEDAFNVMSLVWIGHYMWAIPVKIGVLLYLLHRKLGVSALIGATLCIVTMTPLQFFIGKKMSVNSKAISHSTDDRLRRLNEIFLGIKVVKLSGLEEQFDLEVQTVRNRELQLLNYDSLYWAIMTFLTHASSALVTLVTFGIYMFIENSSLAPADVFAALALFNQLTVPLFIFPITVPIVISAMVSTKRLEDFLTKPEVQLKSKASYTHEEECVVTGKTGGHPPSEIEPFGLDNITESDEFVGEGDKNEGSKTMGNNASCGSDFYRKIDTNSELKLKLSLSWTNDTEPTTISIPTGKMTLVVGAVGSGKSSLLLALLGEMPTNHDQSPVRWHKRPCVAYCSQKPWLLNNTVRENIIFGKSYQPQRYGSVIAACALQTDLNILPGKDLTEIGEKGISLSGGQKHRVAIARALYAHTDVIIMDDPLSALDYQVGQHLVEEGFKKLGTEKGRTLILATHCLQLLNIADHIIVMDHGRVSVQGTLAQVQTERSDLAEKWRQAMIKPQEDYPNTVHHLNSKGERTAKERWHLIRLVSRFGRQQRTKSWSFIHGKAPQTSSHFTPLSRRFSRSLYGSHHYTYNFPLPLDECENSRIIFSDTSTWEKPLRRTRSTTTSTSDAHHHHRARRKVSRVSSLQPQLVASSVQNGTPSCAWDEANDTDSTNKKSLRNQNRTAATENPMPWLCDIVNPSQSLSLPDKDVHEPETSKEFSACSENFDKEDADVLTERRLTSEEERKYGEIPAHVYLTYIQSCTGITSCAYILSTLGWQTLRVYTDFWLTEWTGHNSTDTSLPSATVERQMFEYLMVYAILSILTIVLSLTSNILGQIAGAKSRSTLHRNLLSNLLRCPIKFFDATPIGRIIDRFSSDIAVIDKKLPTSVQRLMQFLLLCFSALVVNAVLSPWFLLPALPICFTYYCVQRFYRVSSRELQRIDSMTRSPILSYFSETLGGLASIRAYDQQSRFMDGMLLKMDIHNNLFLVLNAANRWLGIALDCLGGAIVLVSVNGTLLAAHFQPHIVTPSLVGLAINYTLLVPIYLNWVVKFFADVEMYMGAVERVKQYTIIPCEDYRLGGLKVSSSWPEKGDILMKNVTLRYDENRRPVVSNLNLHIPAGQKVGLCGRTGSGKTSLVMSLFRMLDVTEGRILMDGVDISQLPLHLLRSRLSIIPQDVVMFSGTIRENLDPNSQFTEDELWANLELAQLKGMVSALPGGLDAAVKEGGENLSVGTRQLFSLSKAILHNAAVLVMDEATSSVDTATEQSLLSAAMSAFSHRTVVIIAHRLSTILDCDRILVLEAGKIIEDGAPVDLLKREDSIFATMLRASGHLAH